jgi:hypothetical protein
MSLILQGANRTRQSVTEFGLDFGLPEEYLCNPWSIFGSRVGAAIFIRIRSEKCT